MSPTTFPIKGSVTPFLALPTELKLQIISYLPQHKSPSLVCLRRTHTSFRDIIPQSDIRSKPSLFLLRSQLLDTELNHSYLLLHHCYPCYRCTAVLPFQDFHPWMVQCNLVLGGACAYYRFCYRCGFKSETREKVEWEIEGQKYVLQSRPVAHRPFNPWFLSYGRVGIPRFFFVDYNPTAPSISECPGSYIVGSPQTPPQPLGRFGASRVFF